jgi:hypothetical protein
MAGPGETLWSPWQPLAIRTWFLPSSHPTAFAIPHIHIKGFPPGQQKGRLQEDKCLKIKQFSFGLNLPIHYFSKTLVKLA